MRFNRNNNSIRRWDDEFDFQSFNEFQFNFRCRWCSCQRYHLARSGHFNEAFHFTKHEEVCFVNDCDITLVWCKIQSCMILNFIRIFRKDPIIAEGLHISFKEVFVWENHMNEGNWESIQKNQSDSCSNSRLASSSTNLNENASICFNRKGCILSNRKLLRIRFNFRGWEDLLKESLILEIWSVGGNYWAKVRL